MSGITIYEVSKREEENYFDYLFEKIRETCFRKSLDAAFLHGQVLFAEHAGLITREQSDELSNMIPEY